MGYLDGNTVTALWNYAEHYAMSDNSYGSTFGPSTPGAINLVAGQTNGVTDVRNGQSGLADGGSGSLTLISDPDPMGDVCSATTHMLVSMTGNNIGDLLNDANVSWGWFSGGFDLTIKNQNGTTSCQRSSKSPASGKTIPDYMPHHEPFQYYRSTANPTHAPPTSTQSIGHRGDAANHQYDIHDFFDAVKAHNFPAVQFPEGPGVPGRACRILQSSRRANFLSAGAEFPAMHSRMEGYGRGCGI